MVRGHLTLYGARDNFHGERSRSRGVQRLFLPSL
jgi:hypothetical protein